MYRCVECSTTNSPTSSDLLAASYNLSRPGFPCFWDEDIEDVSWQSRHFLLDECGSATGQGFEDKVPKGLPAETRMVLVNLGRVDQIMERCRDRRLSDHDLKKVVDLRNRAHHQLLDLPSWDDLSEGVRDEVDCAAYECCRLAAMLYSTAVIFPQPPHSGWHMRLVRDIKARLSSAVVDAWSRDAPALLLWVLVVAGIASFRSPERHFFEHSLRCTLKSRNYLVPKLAVRTALRDFMFAEGACGRGFTELWDALELGAVGELDVE